MGNYIVNCLNEISKDDEEIKVEVINKQNKSEIKEELNKQNNTNTIENENLEKSETEEILDNYIIAEIYIEDSCINK